MAQTGKPCTQEEMSHVARLHHPEGIANDPLEGLKVQGVVLGSMAVGELITVIGAGGIITDIIAGGVSSGLGDAGIQYIDKKSVDAEQTAWATGMGAIAGGAGGFIVKGGAGQKVLGNSIETQTSIDNKLTTYLLEKNHPVGGSKAEWFDQALGFNKSNSSQLSKQIVFDANSAVQTDVTKFGVKYNQIIKITGANGKQINVNFGWIKNNDGVVRLVTAIPSKK